MKTSSWLLCFTVCGVGDASAASITWSNPAAIVSADTALSQPGTVVGAEAWGGGNTTVTLSSGASIFFLQGSQNGANSFASTSGSFGETGGDTAQFANANPNFQQALGDFEYDGNQVLTLHNLTIGGSYALQIFAIDDRGCCGGDSEYFSTAISGNSDNSQSFQYFQNQFVIGSFIADGTDQTVYLFSPELGSTGGLETNLNAVVLYEAPEPGTVALVAAGLLVAGFKLRRKRSREALLQ
jgi:hypothetical protein